MVENLTNTAKTELNEVAQTLLGIISKILDSMTQIVNEN